MNDFKEMEHDLGDALHNGLSGFSQKGLQSALGTASRSPTKATAPSALSEAGDTLNDANRIVTRVLELADRLCGPVPTDGSNDASQYFGDGDLGRLRATMRDTRQAFVFADEALVPHRTGVDRMTLQQEMDRAAIKQFETDLRDMTAAQIEAEIDVVQYRIDDDTAWVEALHAKQRQMEASK